MTERVDFRASSFLLQPETVPSPPKAVPLGKVAANAVSRRKGYPRQSLQQAVYRLIYQFVAFCERN